MVGAGAVEGEDGACAGDEPPLVGEVMGRVRHSKIRAELVILLPKTLPPLLQGRLTQVCICLAFTVPPLQRMALLCMSSNFPCRASHTILASPIHGGHCASRKPYAWNAHGLWRMAAASHLLGGEAELELLGDPLGLPLLWRLLWLPLLLLLDGVGDGVAPLDDGELDGEPFWPLL